MQKNRSCFIKLFSLIFPHLGLLVLVFIYMIAGAFLFQTLEKSARIQSCQEGASKETAIIRRYRQSIFNLLFVNITDDETMSDNETAYYIENYVQDSNIEQNRNFKEIMKEFRMNLIRIQDDYRYTGQNCSLDDSWSFKSAFLFTLSLITSIGYGNIVPITWEGKIVSISYSIIGIPFFLLSIANISQMLSSGLRYVYVKIFNSIKRFLCKKREIMEDDDSTTTEVPLFIVVFIFSIYILIGAYLFENFENLSFAKSVYFTFVTVATIGFGDFVPGESDDETKRERNLIITISYIIIGMAMLVMCFDLIQNNIKKNFKLISNKLNKTENKTKLSAISCIESNKSNQKLLFYKSKQLKDLNLKKKSLQ
jgi:hypothetical protein